MMSTMMVALWANYEAVDGDDGDVDDGGCDVDVGNTDDAVTDDANGKDVADGVDANVHADR